MTENWVPFEEGEYIVVDAFLTTPDGMAVGVEKAYIEVYKGPKGLRRLRGSGMIRPALMVELHEENDHLDLLLDLGGKYKYRLENPALHSGKVFAPDVNALFQFYPSEPWEKLSEPEYEEWVGRLNVLNR